MLRILILCVAFTLPALAQPDPIAASEGLRLRLTLGADGVQIYRCAAEAAGPRWIFEGPEAALFDQNGRQIGTHGAGPWWRLNDGSLVRATVVAQRQAPAMGSIPWLLLRVSVHEGEGLLAPVTEIRRIDTVDGTAPAAGCDAASLGQEARMRYSANYLFYGP
jgi:hypothetical protein